MAKSMVWEGRTNDLDSKNLLISLIFFILFEVILNHDLKNSTEEEANLTTPEMYENAIQNFHGSL